MEFTLDDAYLASFSGNRAGGRIETACRRTQIHAA
jgi:hypothetical protein